VSGCFVTARGSKGELRVFVGFARVKARTTNAREIKGEPWVFLGFSVVDGFSRQWLDSR
jgi:hypothetical protein